MKSINDSPGQRARYFQLAHDAYRKESNRLCGDIAPFNSWRRQINLDTVACYSIKEMNQTTDFDKVMLELAILAEDIYWIGRLSSAAERRISWIIKEQFIPDLEFLEKRKIGWDYIKSICTQAGIPSDINDCPAELLIKIMQMVDTHIRRLAKRDRIELIDLPSGYFRRGWKPAAAKAKFRHDHHHHVTHSVPDRAGVLA
jgi:hypothetical protein